MVLWLGADAVSGIDGYELSLDGGPAVRLNEAAGYTFPNVAEGACRRRLRPPCIPQRPTLFRPERMAVV